MDNPQNRRALDALNKVDGNGLNTTIKAVAVGLIVLFAGAIGKYIWGLQEQIDALEITVLKEYVLMAVHVKDIGKLSSFVAEGKRVTLARDKGVQESLRELTAKHEVLRLVVDENRLVVARMPYKLTYPFTPEMRSRLDEAEKLGALNAARIEALRQEQSRAATD